MLFCCCWVFSHLLVINNKLNNNICPIICFNNKIKNNNVKRDSPMNILKIAQIPELSKNGTVPKRSQPIMSETDCNVIHYPTVGNKHWMFDPRLVDFPHKYMNDFVLSIKNPDNR